MAIVQSVATFCDNKELSL